MAEQALSWGAGAVLIKCGTKGLYLRTGEKVPACLDDAWSNKTLLERAYRAEHFCSAVGAGDVSIAAFLTSALNGETPERCLQLAAGAGACCVTAFDACSGLLPLEKLAEKIDAGWEKIPY